MNGELSYAAAFIAGVSGSLHCMAMCGGLSGALGVRARAAGKTAAGAFAHTAIYQLGRLLSYAMAGALGGGVGGVMLRLVALPGLMLYLRLTAGILIVLMGCQMLFSLRLLTAIEKSGAMVWRTLAPLSQKIPRSGISQALLLGALWGWLPCGLVYSMLLLGVLGGSALHGALLMLVFGLGTLPMMMSSSLLMAQMQRIFGFYGWKVMSGVLMVGFGMWTIRMAVQHH